MRLLPSEDVAPWVRLSRSWVVSGQPKRLHQRLGGGRWGGGGGRRKRGGGQLNSPRGGKVWSVECAKCKVRGAQSARCAARGVPSAKCVAPRAGLYARVGGGVASNVATADSGRPGGSAAGHCFAGGGGGVVQHGEGAANGEVCRHALPHDLYCRVCIDGGPCA